VLLTLCSHFALLTQRGRSKIIPQLKSVLAFADTKYGALNRHVERVFDTSRKPHHWGKTEAEERSVMTAWCKIAAIECRKS
jgi:hypothetical protein